MAKRTQLTTVILFTNTFPYGTGEQFLETEINYLADSFEKVIIVPGIMEGEPRPVPRGVEIETSLAKLLVTRRKKAFRLILPCIFNPLFYGEFFTRHLRLLHIRALRRLVGYLSEALIVRRWILSFLHNTNTNIEEVVFYTYWLGARTLGVGLARERFPEMKLISRTHRGDLYEERQQPPYLPIRIETLRLSDCICPISDHGRRYLHGRYNPNGTKIIVSRLGVCDPGFSAARSDDGIFRIVSCSFMVPVKRLHLLIEGLKVFAQSREGIPIEWYHIGDGPLRKDLEKAAVDLLPSTVRRYFKGQVDNREVIEFYKTHPVDVFVNVSQSEGIPVSIMEAQSFGIPVIATAVGGTPEIVDNSNGVLLERNPSPVSVARALECVALNEGETLIKKEMAKKTWESMYNAERNYKEFVNLIGTCFNKEG